MAEAQNLSAYINKVLKTYDKKLRPNAGGIVHAFGLIKTLFTGTLRLRFAQHFKKLYGLNILRLSQMLHVLIHEKE